MVNMTTAEEILLMAVPAVVLIGALVMIIAFLDKLRRRGTEVESEIRVSRIGSILGAVAIVPLILLGGVWPSPVTFVALLSLPAFFVFIAAAIRPQILARHQKLRYYTSACVIGSGVCWAFEIAWLAFLCKAVGQCQ
jgi:hypothetical protein